MAASPCLGRCIGGPLRPSHGRGCRLRAWRWQSTLFQGEAWGFYRIFRSQPRPMPFSSFLAGPFLVVRVCGATNNQGTHRNAFPTFPFQSASAPLGHCTNLPTKAFHRTSPPLHAAPFPVTSWLGGRSVIRRRNLWVQHARTTTRNNNTRDHVLRQELELERDLLGPLWGRLSGRHMLNHVLLNHGDGVPTEFHVTEFPRSST
jgi:hypothetical protein